MSDAWTLIWMAVLFVGGGLFWHFAVKAVEAMARDRAYRERLREQVMGRHPAGRKRSRIETGTDFILWRRQLDQDADK